MPRARRAQVASEGRLGGLLKRVQLASKIGTVNERAREAEPDLDLYEPLLGSVMKVAFEPASLAFGRLHDSQPRRAQLLHEDASIRAGASS